MTKRNYLDDYARDNAEPAVTKFVYLDTTGREYASEGGENFANTTNAILLLVDDFNNKRGVFDPHNFSDSDWAESTQEDLNDAISQLMVDLHNDFT